eukprot:8106608-Pyramimonas_sp.AAC.1
MPREDLGWMRSMLNHTNEDSGARDELEWIHMFKNEPKQDLTKTKAAWQAACRSFEDETKPKLWQREVAMNVEQIVGTG